MKRSILAIVAFAIVGCATPSTSHYTVTPKVRVIERTQKKVSHTPVVVAAGAAGDAR